MNAYYDDPVAAKCLISEAELWVGTPFAAHGALQGVGVDCIHLAKELYRRTGALPDIALPFYNTDHSRHHQTSSLIPEIEATGRFAVVDGQPQTGDLLCFRFGAAPFHLGVALHGDLFIHALASRAVIVSSLQDATWKKRLVRVYRPKA